MIIFMNRSGQLLTRSVTGLRFCHQKLKVKNSLPFSEIPTARRLPFFGTTLDMIAAGSAPKLHKYINARHQEFGPIFREFIGPIEAVFLSCPKLMRSLFLYEGQYPTHPLPDAWIIYNKKHSCRRGLFFMDGPEWHTNRKLMNQLLLNGDMDRMRSLVSSGTERIITKWKEEAKNVNQQFYEIQELEEQLYRWSIDVIMSVMLGEVYNSASPVLIEAIDEFALNVHKVFDDSSKLMNFPAKIAEFFNLEIWKEFERNVTKVLHLGNRIIDYSMMEFQSGNGLLAAMLERGMALDDVKRIFVDLIIAAGDTTAFSSIWALYSIALNENVQNLARHDANRLEKKDNQSYVKGIIRETLRLYPVAPFIGRFLAKDAVIGGYEIQQGTLVLLSLYTSGRDNSNFIDAKNFDPTRWMRNEAGELCGVLHAHGSVPFALGSRSCIGRKIAMLQMQTLIESVVWNFQLAIFNDKPVDVILRLVAVPDSKIRLGIKTLNKIK